MSIYWNLLEGIMWRTGQVKYFHSFNALRAGYLVAGEVKQLERYPVLNVIGLFSEGNIPVQRSSASLNVKKSHLHNRTMPPVLW